MTTETQDAGTATTDAGGTQTTDTTQTAVADTTTQTTDTTTADTKPAEGEVNYDIKVPDDMPADEAVITEYKALAKELKLAPEAAQKMVDFNVKLEQRRAEAFVNQVKTWGEQVQADKEIGTPEALATAKKAIDDLGTPELRDLLNSTGMGNHPAVVRFALAVGKAISEDRILAGRDGGETAPRDAATILYGTPTKT